MEQRTDTSDPKALRAALVAIGVSQPYASQLVSGARTPSARLALDIEARLGVPVSFWFAQREAA